VEVAADSVGEQRRCGLVGGGSWIGDVLGAGAGLALGGVVGIREGDVGGPPAASVVATASASTPSAITFLPSRVPVMLPVVDTRTPADDAPVATAVTLRTVPEELPTKSRATPAPDEAVFQHTLSRTVDPEIVAQALAPVDFTKIRSAIPPSSR
jgi:hypothetical protein